MIVHGEAAREESVAGAASLPRSRRNPKSFLKLILLGFALVGLPLIIALINSAFSIDRLADQSRKAVYQAAQIAHSSRAWLMRLPTMERAVRQAHILGDTSLLEGYFRAHKKFESMSDEPFRAFLACRTKTIAGRSCKRRKLRFFRKVSADKTITGRASRSDRQFRAPPGFGTNLFVGRLCVDRA